MQYRDTCGKCGATRVDKQMGLEQTPAEYVAGMVALFRELRRALHPTGTLWLNLGSSYAGSGRGLMGDGTPSDRGDAKQGTNRGTTIGHFNQPDWGGFKPKDLIPIPWMVAMGLQQDGWYLRSDIILAKRNPMPESVTDRCTRSHEYVFMLSKSPSYFYDAEAIREDRTEGSLARWNGAKHRIVGDKNASRTGKPAGVFDQTNLGAGRNKRTVWDVVTKGYPKAHFATFNPDWIRPMILAGTSAYGTCAACGSPYVRVVERTGQIDESAKGSRFDRGKTAVNGNGRVQEGERYTKVATGWQPSCECFGHFEKREIPEDRQWMIDEGITTKEITVYVPDGPQPDTVPAIVLDPFMGSGTTAAVCVETGRDWLGFEPNEDYVKLAYERIYGAQPALFAQGVV